MPVLIGLIDQYIEVNKETAWDVNKIGGRPSWLHSSSSRAGNIPKCKKCGSASSLVCQLYCPLGGSPYHRCLYVFACVSRCSRSKEGWTVLRSMKYDETYAPTTESKKPEKSVVQTDDWLVDQEDWGQGSNDWGERQDEWGEDEETSDSTTKSLIQTSSESKVLSFPAHEGFTSQQDSVPFVCQTLKNANTAAERSSKQKTSFPSLCHSGENSSSEDTMKGPQEGSPTNSKGAGNRMDVIRSVEKQTCDLSMLSLSDETKQSQNSAIDSSDEPMEEVVLTETPRGAQEERWAAMMELLNTQHGGSLRVSGPSPGVKGEAVLRGLYLNVVDEPSRGPQDMADHVTELMQQYERSEGVSLAGLGQERPKPSKAGGESYEKTELKHGDKTFHKFLKRLRRCPEQCVRYERDGSPILASTLEQDELAQMSPCAMCGGDRVFEVQLVSPLIPWLQLQDGSASPVEFATVLVYTCALDCWAEGEGCQVVTEGVLVQADPDQHLYR